MGSFVGAVTLSKRNLLVTFAVDPLSLVHSSSHSLLRGTTRRMLLSKTTASPSWIIINFRCRNIYTVHVVGAKFKGFHSSKQHHSLQNLFLCLHVSSDAANVEDIANSHQLHSPILEEEEEITSHELAGSTDTVDDDLRSTWRQQLWVGFGCSVLAAMAMKTIREVDSIEGFAAALISAALAYWVADLGTGIYHWAIDNYGDESSLLFGSQINAFQGHHERPWTITKRAFANNLHSSARPAGLLLLPAICAPSMNVSLDAFVAVFTACVVFSQQFHAWSHMKKSQLPSLVMLLQDHGLLVSPKMHGQHHRHPFNCNYCIVSGIWNPLLDSSRFFHKLEQIIYATWKVVPRSWESTTPQHQASYFD